MLITNPGGFPTVVLAHGSTTPMDAPFLETVSQGLGDAGAEVVRFEFPFMAARRKDGMTRKPDELSVLVAAWLDVLARFEASRTVIGGKSLGGRVASMLADELGAAGLLCLGYPFHHPDKPQNLRTTHMRSIETPTLVVQGTEDRFGKRHDVEKFDLSSAVDLHWLERADHSFEPTEQTRTTTDGYLAAAVAECRRFIQTTPALF